MADVSNVLNAIDQTLLTELVAEMLGCEQCSPGETHIHAMRVGEENGCELFHVYGSAQTGSDLLPWSLVLKIIHPPAEYMDSPQAYVYWKREPMLYLSGLLNTLPDGLTAPRCYEVTQQPDGSAWMWQEEVRDIYHRHWPLEYYQTAARCLGRFNSAFLGERPLPKHPALAIHGLRNALEHACPAIEVLASSLDQPLLRLAMAGANQAFFLRAWQERLEILDILEQFPDSFCYQNASRNNLFAWQSPNRHEQLIAVDWTYAGLAPAGIELAPLLYESVAGFGSWGIPSQVELTRQLMDGYLEGLSEAGAAINPVQVQFACMAAMFWRYMLAGFAQKTVSHLLCGENNPPQDQQQWADRVAATHPPFLETYEQVQQLKARL
jgi:hypothetical protein